MSPTRTFLLELSVVAIALGVYAFVGPTAIILFGCILWSMVSLALNRWFPRSVFSEQISLMTSGVVEKHFHVRLSDEYELWLDFERQGQTDEEMNRLVGVPTVSDGVSVPVRWKVTDPDTGKVVAFGEHESKSSNSGSRTHFGRLIGHLSMLRGTYVFHGAIARDVPAFQTVVSSLRVCYSSARGRSWLNAVNHLACITAAVVALPVAVFAAIVLCVRWLAA